MVNILENVEKALCNKSFSNGLAYFTQDNCKCSITNDRLYRIYRTPNINGTTNKTTWGGVIIRPFSSIENALVQNHSYILKFEVKGKTSTSISDIRWSSDAGWEYYGCNPHPTTLYSNMSEFKVANLNLPTWKPFVWAFTINDTIYKTCTNPGSGRGTNGTSYLSYRDFKFGFDYNNTGEWGSEIYLKNFRMYDITNLVENHSIKQNGIINIDNIVEEFNKVSISFDNELLSNEIYEI